MRKFALIAVATIAIAGPALAEPARALRSLIGARAAGGESELMARGFVAGKSVNAQGGRVVFWGKASDRTCVKVLTRNGRYASIVDAPASSCGLRNRPIRPMQPIAKARIDDLMGKSGVSVFDIMQSRGFAGVDSFPSGNDLINIYWNRGTRQCVQVITSSGNVVAVTDIRTHPKCR